jgi:hypothetical protein
MQGYFESIPPGGAGPPPPGVHLPDMVIPDVVIPDVDLPDTGSGSDCER